MPAHPVELVPPGKIVAILRIQLYTASQILKGQDLEDFWNLIDEVRQTRIIKEASSAPVDETPE